MKKIFLTFADKRLQRSLDRIANQAETMGCYDTIITATEYDLDEGFRTRFADKLRPEVRGFGYWSWKPQIILQTMATVAEGDIIQYTDAGCHLNPAGKERLDYYFERAGAAQIGILAFQARAPEHPLAHDGRKLFDLPEYKWTKGDLLDHLVIRDNHNILNSPTIGAGVMFIRNGEQAKNIIQIWQKTIEHDFHLIDDSPSKSPNFEGFIEHRHDQSIFSILCKLNDIDTLSGYEFYYPRKKSLRPDWSMLSDFPIHARRDKQYDNLSFVKLKLAAAMNVLWKVIRREKS